MISPSVLYITRNGLLEPLGQSQVFSYIKGLSKHYRFTLVTFEKPEDLADELAMSRAKAQCESLGITWLPQRFYYRPALLAPAWCMLQFFFLCLREARRGNADLIHARSYIPAAVALIVNRFTGTPFIFDMRALWPEELITAGRLKRDSMLHKIMVWAERSCLQRAAGVVSLTHAAVQYLRTVYPKELSAQRMVVIPTCADLERFAPSSDMMGKEPMVFGCLGTVLSGWFKLDWLVYFMECAVRRYPHAQFEVVTRDDAEEVRRRMAASEALASRLRIFAVTPDKAHEVAQGHTVSLMFFTEGLSKLGSSPTRMGEVLGCGRPVIANQGVGDVARIVREYRVGVLVDDASEAGMESAFRALEALQGDPELAVRCRAAAEEVFSLERGTAAYRQLYADILADRRAR